MANITGDIIRNVDANNRPQWAETHFRAVKNSAGKTVEDLDNEVSQLDQKVGDFSDYDTEGYEPMTLSPTTGYYYSFQNLEAVESSLYEYVAIQVQPGEKYYIDGYNLNSNAPLAFVMKAGTTTKARAISDSTAKHMTGEYTIPEGYDTLYVNGRTANYPIAVQKWILHPGSAATAVEKLDEAKVDKVEGKELSSNDYTGTDKSTVSYVNDNYKDIAASHGKNLVDLNALTEGYRIIKTDGRTHADSDYAYATIDVSDLTGIVVSASISLTSGVVVAKYNGDTFISYVDQIDTGDATTGRKYATLDVSDATVVKMSLLKSVWNIRRIQVESGTTPTAYEPYYLIPAESFLSPSTLAPQVKTFFGSGAKVTSASMEDDDELAIPIGAIRKNQRIHFYAKVTSFDTIYVGKGKTDKGYILKVDNTNIQFKSGVDSAGGTEVPHGLTIATYIEVLIDIKADSSAIIRLSTLGGSYSRNLASWSNVCGDVFAMSIGSSLTECWLGWSSSDLRKPVWLFGDSYLSHYSVNRWPYYMVVADNNDCCLINAFPGEDSDEAFADFIEDTKYGAPQMLVWTLGMNNPDDGAVNPRWLDVVENLESYCEAHGTTLVLATIPNVPSYTHTYKNAWVKASGYRYIDFAEAVEAEEAASTWIAGTLSTDNVHPTAEGARLLCARALADVPELLGQIAPMAAS